MPIFDALLEQSSDFLLLKDGTGSVPLHHAMDNLDMNSDAVIKLIVANSDAVNVKDNKGLTCLHKAVMHDNLSPEIISFMLAVCPSSVSERTRKGELPMHLLLKSNSSLSSAKVKEAVFNILLEADIKSIESEDTFGRVPIHDALLKQHPPISIIETIIKLQPQCLTVVDQHKNTPLHLAVGINSLECVRLFISLYPAAASMQNSDGFTPIIVALKAEHSNYNSAIIKEILSMCPESAAIKCTSGEKLPGGGYTGNLPLHYALNLHPTDLKMISATIRSFPKAIDIPFMEEKNVSPLNRAMKCSDTVLIDIMLSGGMESLMTSVVDDDDSVEPEQDEHSTHEPGGLTQEQYDHYKDIFLHCSNQKGKAVNKKGLKLMFNVLGEKVISAQEQSHLLAKGKLNLYEFLEFMQKKFDNPDSKAHSELDVDENEEKDVVEQKIADAFADLRMQRPTSKLGSAIKCPTSYFVGTYYIHCPFNIH